jgi:diaminopimelate decarboxylase
MSALATEESAAKLRARCQGEAPLTARLEPWQMDLCTRTELEKLLERHGSPLNLIDPAPMARNASGLTAAASGAGLELGVYFARKANKALALVDEARRLGLGVDVASERELAQTIERGMPGGEIVVTAAVKPAPLMELGLRSGATLVIDNLDELDLLTSLAARHGLRTPVALRLTPELDDKASSRFGLQEAEAMAAAQRLREAGLFVEGIHFHIDGYDAGERVAVIGQALALVDRLLAAGERPRFLDIGGGVPISYLDSAPQWDHFWAEHRRGLLGEREPLTYRAHGLGLAAHGGEVIGGRNVYPYYQHPVGGEWLTGILDAIVTVNGRATSVATAISSRDLELRCEPGRALLDGCGMTVARVMFTKGGPDGSTLVGLEMNRTQCRSTSDEFLVDPLLLPGSESAAGAATAGFLVGAYCIERELLSWRRLRFPDGVGVGDLVVFPNTAGYQMHIVESASHQIPLARNLIVGGQAPRLDPIDEPSFE